MLFANDVRTEDLAEEFQLGLAGGRRPRGDVEDGAVVLAQPDRAVRAECGVGEITLIALDDSELADALQEQGFRGDSFGHLSAHAVAELASASGEDLVEEIVPTDRLDGGQQAGSQAVVVGREEVLGVGRDVVQVARPADPVTDRLPAHEMGGFECPELLEDARPAGPDALGELVRGAGAIESKAEEQVTPQA